MPPEEWTSIPVPAIIEESLFDAVQEQLHENKQRNREAKQGAKYLLQGLLVCTCCGYALKGSRCRGRIYYRCGGSVKHGGDKHGVCPSRSMRGSKLEEAIWADVSALLAEPDRIQDEYERRLNIGNESRDALTSQRKLRMQTARVQRQIDVQALSERRSRSPRSKDCWQARPGSVSK
jgi:site-specific DNA recombinase